jgi:TrmH family RNA methyltransferase
MSISKNKIKYIHSLESKKGRKEDNVFLAEGNKIVTELLGQMDCTFLAATPEWLTQHRGAVVADEVAEVSHEELSKASLLKAPQQVLGVFRQPDYQYDKSLFNGSLSLALDDVQDPGNLGTIIRIADWFGIENIFCSKGTVDVYNPKVVQATMGAIARVRVHYVDLPELIGSLQGVPVYGTFLDGQDMYQRELSSNGLIVMGNEGNGIGPEIEKLISDKLYIPNFPAERATSESLNVAVATAIVCAEFRRRLS